MSLREDTRGVSTLIGVIFVVFFLVIALAINQVAVVPNENEQWEFDHYTTVQDDMVEVGGEVVSVAGRNASGSPTVDLGLMYPPHTFALNPPPAAGRLEKHPMGDIAVDGTISSTGDSFTTSDLCGGGASTYGIKYTPGYNVLTADPIIYENGQVYVNGTAGDAVIDSRTVINTTSGNKVINIYRLVGPLPNESQISALSLDMKGSTIIGKNTINVTSVTFPSNLSASKWASVAIDNSSNDDIDNVESVNSGVKITFASGAGYTVRCYTIGVEGTAPPTAFGSAFKTKSANVSGGGGSGSGGSGASPAENLNPNSSNGVFLQNSTLIQGGRTENPTDPDLTANITLKNLGSSERNITDIRVAFFFVDGSENTNKAELVTDIVEVDTIALDFVDNTKDYNIPTGFLTVTGQNTGKIPASDNITIRFTFDQNAKLASGSGFFIVGVKFEDGSTATYFATIEGSEDDE